MADRMRFAVAFDEEGQEEEDPVDVAREYAEKYGLMAYASTPVSMYKAFIRKFGDNNKEWEKEMAPLVVIMDAYRKSKGKAFKNAEFIQVKWERKLEVLKLMKEEQSVFREVILWFVQYFKEELEGASLGPGKEYFKQYYILKEQLSLIVSLYHLFQRRGQMIPPYPED